MPPWQKTSRDWETWEQSAARLADNRIVPQTSPSHVLVKRGAFVHLQWNRIDVAHLGQFLVRMNGSVDDLLTQTSGLG